MEFMFTLFLNKFPSYDWKLYGKNKTQVLYINQK